MMDNIYAYDTEYCREKIKELEATGLFDEGVFQDICGAGFCYEISWCSLLGSAGSVPHNVYWSPNKASYAVGYTGSYIQYLCKEDKIDHYWYAGGYILSPKALIELRKRYLARQRKND